MKKHADGIDPFTPRLLASIAQRMKRLLSGLWLALLPCTYALAQTGTACSANANAAEQNACALAEFQAVDAAIAERYADVRRALSAQERPYIRQEQNDWLRSRDAQCQQAERAKDARPDGPSKYYECLTRETQARRSGIMRWLSSDSPAQQ